MLIDCDRCEMRDIKCADCVVTALLGGAAPRHEISEAEHQALRVLADAQLVPPLRLQPRRTAAGGRKRLREAS
jgi:hypothetical protein